MSSSEEENEDDRPRSKNCDLKSLVVFNNRTERRAALYWINYEGELVRYKVLDNGKAMVMDTFETHPWLARDAVTGDILTLNQSKIYYPRAWQGEEERTLVQIDIPCKSFLRGTLV